MPPPLRELRYNPKSGFYEIQEDGITYKMRLEETREIKHYFRSSTVALYPTVADWYRLTNRVIRKQIMREGDVLADESNGFYPDHEWPE
jgi:hypothetical protein